MCTCFQYFLRPPHRAAKLPPGPYPLPIIGNILHFGQNPHQSLAKLSRTHGPLMSIHLGRIFSVVASSPQTAKQVLGKHDHAFSSRTIPMAVHAHAHHQLSLCKEHMFCTPQLEASRGLRQEKLVKLYDYVKRCCDAGRAVDIGEAAFITTLNLVSELVVSSEVTAFDPDGANEFKHDFESISSVMGQSNLVDFFPVLERIDPQGIQRRAQFCMGKLLDFIEGLVNQRLESRGRVTSAKKTDLLEKLLDLNQESDQCEFSINDIKHLVLDLFLGATETVANTVEWAMTELLLNPEKLSKAKQELRTVIIGENKQVQESDIPKLPYLQAAIKETLRLHPPVPLLIPRKSEYDVQMSGYTIPKHTLLSHNTVVLSAVFGLWAETQAFGRTKILLSPNDS
ncbi:ferruginol synthase [Phtheirospermum japonicum]|uniref:Ferruginol synthase n=1 Tax=Phtheirospermum japonicum TaxID=374723 RepID=A0A830CKM2_9LAMI|nr:ferruginol synthase [Phtheirospermum japonicum]